MRHEILSALSQEAAFLVAPEAMRRVTHLRSASPEAVPHPAERRNRCFPCGPTCRQVPTVCGQAPCWPFRLPATSKPAQGALGTRRQHTLTEAPGLQVQLRVLEATGLSLAAGEGAGADGVGALGQERAP